MPVDDHIVPIQTRCPACTASVPSAAAWCSLCHADLRLRTAPLRAAPSVLPGSSYGAVGSGERSNAAGDETRPGVALEQAAAVGRHSRGRASESARDFGGRGRHAAGGRPARRPVAPTRTMAALPVELPVIVAGSQIDRAEVEVLADRMLGHLAVDEQRSTVLDPADLPGGKWAFIGGGALAVLALLIIISIVVTAFTNR